MRRHEARPPQLLIFVLRRATPLPPARPLTPESSGRVGSHGFLLKKLLTPESSGRVESHGFLLKNNCIFLKQDHSRPAIGQCHSKL